MALADVIKAAGEKWRKEQDGNTKNTTEQKGVTAETPATPELYTSNTSNTTKSNEGKAYFGSVVAHCHARAEWRKARDEWHQHYFGCAICQQFHRTATHRPHKNACTEGARLHQQYLAAC